MLCSPMEGYSSPPMCTGKGKLIHIPVGEACWHVELWMLLWGEADSSHLTEEPGRLPQLPSSGMSVRLARSELSFRC